MVWRESMLNRHAEQHTGVLVWWESMLNWHPAWNIGAMGAGVFHNDNSDTCTRTCIHDSTRPLKMATNDSFQHWIIHAKPRTPMSFRPPQIECVFIKPCPFSSGTRNLLCWWNVRLSCWRHRRLDKAVKYRKVFCQNLGKHEESCQFNCKNVLQKRLLSASSNEVRCQGWIPSLDFYQENKAGSSRFTLKSMLRRSSEILQKVSVHDMVTHGGQGTEQLHALVLWTKKRNILPSMLSFVLIIERSTRSVFVCWTTHKTDAQEPELFFSCFYFWPHHDSRNNPSKLSRFHFLFWFPDFWPLIVWPTAYMCRPFQEIDDLLQVAKD